MRLSDIAKKWGLLVGVLTIASIASASPAFASGAGFPWETPLQRLVDSVTGPVARAVAVLGIVFAGVIIIFSEGGEGVRKLVFVCLGISVIFGAASFFLGFFGFGGGAVI